MRSELPRYSIRRTHARRHTHPGLRAPTCFKFPFWPSWKNNSSFSSLQIVHQAPDHYICPVLIIRNVYLIQCKYMFGREPVALSLSYSIFKFLDQLCVQLISFGLYSPYHLSERKQASQSEDYVFPLSVLRFCNILLPMEFGQTCHDFRVMP